MVSRWSRSTAILDRVTKAQKRKRSCYSLQKSEVTGSDSKASIINCHSCNHKATMSDCLLIYEAEDILHWDLEANQGQIKFDDIVDIYSR